MFKRIGCNVCHVQNITTAPPGTLINGGTFAIPAALGNKIIYPFGDFLLHDIKTGDGIVQAGPQNTANKLRGTERLRLTPTPLHSDEQIEQLVTALTEIWDRKTARKRLAYGTRSPASDRGDRG